MKSRKAKIHEKTWLLRMVREGYFQFDSVRAVLVPLLMSGDELHVETRLRADLWRELYNEPCDRDLMSHLQSIRSKALYGLKSVRADEEIARLAGIVENSRWRGLTVDGYLYLNDSVKAEIAALVNKRREDAIKA